jgi:DNA polymerase III epsilon subunit-like protein
MRYLLLDTATTSRYQSHARLIHVAYIVADDTGQVLQQRRQLIQPAGFQIDNTEIHGITHQQAIQEGRTAAAVLKNFLELLPEADLLVAHNTEYAKKVLFNELRELGWTKTYFSSLYNQPTYCTMESTVDFCNIRDPKRDRLKFPRLVELHEKLFRSSYDMDEGGHSKVNALKDCFFELKRLNVTA